MGSKRARVGLGVVEASEWDFPVPEHDRYYNLQIAELVFGDELGERIGKAFARYLGSVKEDTAVSRWTAFRSLLSWMVEQPYLEAILERYKTDAKVADANEFELIVVGWRDFRCENEKIVKRTTAELIKNTSGSILHLAGEGLLPKIRPLRIPKGWLRSGPRRQSLAEVTKGDGARASDATLETVYRRMPQLRTIAGSAGFIAAICEQDKDIDQKNSGAILASIASLNDSRLAKLRKRAENILCECYAKFAQGQRLMSMEAPCLASYMKNHPGKTFGLNDFKLFFGDNKELAIISLMRFINSHCNGVIPTEDDFIGGRSFWQRLMQWIGGANELKYFLGYSTDAAAAAALIYLVDSGANISVVLGFDTDYEHAADEPGYVLIGGVKARAGHKPIIEFLPVDDPDHKVPAVAALRMLRGMTDGLRKSEPALKNRLFVHKYFSATVLTDSILRNRMRYFCRDDVDLRDLALNPSYIRSSVLLQAALRSEGTLLATQIIADHAGGAGVTEGYALRLPTRLLYAQKIRDFQDSMQAMAVRHAPETAKALGLSEERAQQLLSRLVPTGLGHSCQDPFAGVQPGTSTDAACSAIDSCLGCPMMIFHATTENITDLLVFKEHLEQSRGYWESQREQRWNEVWLPYLAFATVVLEKLKRGPYANLLPQAQSIADIRMQQGYELAPLF